MRVAKFRPKPLFGDEVYSVHWRPAVSNELLAIKPFIPDIKTISMDVIA